MTDGFNSCRNVVCNFTEGINDSVLKYFDVSSPIFDCLVPGKLLVIPWVLFRCNVFVPSNTIATKSC